MKRYLFLLSVALMALAILASCSGLQNNSANSSDGSATQDSLKPSDTNGDNSTKDSSQTPDVPSVGSLTTDNTQTPDIPSTEKINTVVWQFNYAYWTFDETLTGENHSSLLVDYGYLRGGFEKIRIPKV